MTNKLTNVNNKNNTAIILENNQHVTYEELSIISKEIYTHINKRCLIFCICKNELACLAGYISFINNGVVPVMLDENINDTNLAHLVELYKPEYIWCSNDRAVELEDYIDTYRYDTYTLYEYVAITNEDNMEVKEKELHEDLALLLTTSGSTGSPRFVRVSYDNLFSNALSIIEYLQIDNNEITITTLPMNYTYGLSIINTHLIAGGTIVLNSRNVLEKEFWNRLRDNRVTSFGGVPYTYEILDKINFYNMDLPHLKYLTQAGGKLNENLQIKYAEYAEKNNKRFFIMYGQTEATARMSYLPWDKVADKIGSIGIAIPGGRFTIVDNNGCEIKSHNVSGELVYHGSNVTMGYATERSDLSNGYERNGVLLTGDIAKCDEDGYYYIVGRKKRFIKIYGKRINLDEIEQILKKDINDLECMCVGEDDRLIVYVIDGSYNEEIVGILVDKINLYRKVIDVRLVDKIPVNETGKIMYGELNDF